MVEDFMRDYPESISVELAHQQIESVLNSAKMSLSSDFGILGNLSVANEIGSLEANENITANHEEIGQEKLFFIDCPGGTGKTFLYETLHHLIRAKGLQILSVAWTEIAALLLPNGVTLHSRFKLPLKIDATSTIGIRAGSKAAREINAASVVFLDKESMCSSAVLDIVNRRLQDIRNCALPFGGMFLILGGDFRQILPVVRHGTRGELIRQCIISSQLWNQFRVLSLSQNMRTNSDEVAFADWLLQVGNGSANDAQQNVSIPAQCVIRGELATKIFREEISLHEMNDLDTKIILCSTNDRVHELNNKIIRKLSGNLITVKNIDQVICEPGEDSTEYPTEFLNALLTSGLPPHELCLKIGAIVMLLRNLDIKSGLCNGVRLKIVRILSNIIDCEIVTGSFIEKRVLLPRIKLEPTDDIFSFKFQRKQYPVRLSFAMTINKSQGQTFRRVGILLDKPVFAHGQLYVALSRVKAMDSLKIQLPENCQTTKNIVYNEVLE